MNCKKCKAKLQNNSIYCDKCGVPTDFVKTNLSSFKTIKEVFTDPEASMNKHIGYSFIVFLLSILPAFILLQLITAYLKNIHPFFFYALNLLAIALFAPFWTIAIAKETDYLKSPSRIKDYFKLIRFYPSQLFLSIIAMLYLLLLKLICQGDPILNLVHFILILYGLAVIIHAPSIMFDQQINAFAALRKSYVFGKHTIRWQNFFLSVTIVLINLPAYLLTLYAKYLTKYNDIGSWIATVVVAIIAVFCMLYSFPLSWQLIKSQYKKYKTHEILDKNIEKEIG
ncbi:MAG: hypothetical protein RBS16_01615 [Candidatus Cloacimonadales bacterium]|nr:hypothetical protein [Candidatus Cloacimonadota bacterium]MDD2650799.1 hypothetical protein [Candidatus Cloacimonadota bacterium]MDX9976709.1 hypothetical protein [Candidatus Cloacimonadales bacterium]